MMILTTTNSVEDYKILEYRGIVSGTAVNVQKMKMTFNMQKYYAGISENIYKSTYVIEEFYKGNKDKKTI